MLGMMRLGNELCRIILKVLLESCESRVEMFLC